MVKYRILEGCPRCGRFPVSRSHLKGLHERLWQWLTGKSPYRCRNCRWRGWAHDSWDRRQRVLDDGHMIGRRADDKRS